MLRLPGPVRPEHSKVVGGHWSAWAPLPLGSPVLNLPVLAPDYVAPPFEPGPKSKSEVQCQ